MSIMCTHHHVHTSIIHTSTQYGQLALSVIDSLMSCEYQCTSGQLIIRFDGTGCSPSDSWLVPSSFDSYCALVPGTYSVRTACHFARFTPDSDFFHHTFCMVHTVHTVCSELPSKSTVTTHRCHQHPQWDAVLRAELQPDAQVHPELQLQGNSHQAQIMLPMILLPGCDSVPVERCAPGRLVPTRSSIPFNSRGSARLRRGASCMGDRRTMGHSTTWSSPRDPVRSLSRSRRVHV